MMFFKKKESNPKPQPAIASNSASENAPAVLSQTAAPNTAENGKPVYQKPVLRRYDQIDQVKPYGPSEI